MQLHKVKHLGLKTTQTPLDKRCQVLMVISHGSMPPQVSINFGRNDDLLTAFPAHLRDQAL